MTITISGVKFQTTGKTLIPQKTQAVLEYLEATKKGKHLVKKILSSNQK